MDVCECWNERRKGIHFGLGILVWFELDSPVFMAERLSWLFLDETEFYGKGNFLREVAWLLFVFEVDQIERLFDDVFQGGKIFWFGCSPIFKIFKKGIKPIVSISSDINSELENHFSSSVYKVHSCRIKLGDLWHFKFDANFISSNIAIIFSSLMCKWQIS